MTYDILPVGTQPTRLCVTDDEYNLRTGITIDVDYEDMPYALLPASIHDMTAGGRDTGNALELWVTKIDGSNQFQVPYDTGTGKYNIVT